MPGGMRKGLERACYGPNITGSWIKRPRRLVSTSRSQSTALDRSEVPLDHGKFGTKFLESGDGDLVTKNRDPQGEFGAFFFKLSLSAEQFRAGR